MVGRRPLPGRRRRALAAVACALWLLGVEVLPGLHLAFHGDDHTHGADGTIVHHGHGHGAGHHHGPGAGHHHHGGAPAAAASRRAERPGAPAALAPPAHDHAHPLADEALPEAPAPCGEPAPLIAHHTHDHESPTTHRHGIGAAHTHESPAARDHDALAARGQGSFAAHTHESPAGHRHGSRAAHDHESPADHHHESLAAHDHEPYATHDHESHTAHDHGSLAARERAPAAEHAHGAAEHAHGAAEHAHAAAEHDHGGWRAPEHHRPARAPDTAAIDHDPTGHSAAGIAHHAIALHRPPPPLLEPLPVLPAAWPIESAAEQQLDDALRVRPTARGPPAAA